MFGEEEQEVINDVNLTIRRLNNAFESTPLCDIEADLGKRLFVAESDDEPAPYVLSGVIGEALGFLTETRPVVWKVAGKPGIRYIALTGTEMSAQYAKSVLAVLNDSFPKVIDAHKRSEAYRSTAEMFGGGKPPPGYMMTYVRSVALAVREAMINMTCTRITKMDSDRRLLLHRKRQLTWV